MSAIAGLYRWDGFPVDRTLLVHMLSRLEHRGPDVATSWNDGPVGLASAILRTAPPTDRRPAGLARRADDALVVAADVRLDNRPELLRALGIPTAETASDTELVLMAYEAWGANAPARLIGDFAFAIWDGRRGTLFCARDPVGVRPFCYHRSDRGFVFASEIKALFCVAEVPHRLDEVQVGYFLESFMDDPERTIYQGIRRLPAAHFLEVGPDHVRLERYWELDPEREVLFPSDDQYAEAFREVFTEAVRCRLRNADPVGAALSGGLDSSSIVAVARPLLAKDRPLHTFSAVFPGLPDDERYWNDESEYIDAALAAAEGIVSHRVRVDDIPPLHDYDRVFQALDAPPLTFNMYMSWALFGAARDHGVRVFLEGTDGDSVVSSGFERFFDLANAGRWRTLVEEVAALTRRHEYPRNWYPRRFVYPHLSRLARSFRWGDWLRASREIEAGLGRSRRGLILRYGIGAFVPESVWERSRRRGQEPQAPRSLIRSEFAARIGLRERMDALALGVSASGREMHARILMLPRYQFSMEVLDGAAAPFGVEPRYPYMDRRVMEYCVAVPSDQKLRDGWPRSIQRRGMEGVLPPLIQWRLQKQRLGYSFIRGMKDVEAPGVNATLFDQDELREFVDLDVARDAYERVLSSDPSLEIEGDTMLLYKAIVLARWLRDHGPGAA